MRAAKRPWLAPGVRALGTHFATLLGMTSPTETAPELRSLSLRECRRRLEEGGIARVAIHTGKAPLLRPVNFLAREDHLVVRTGEGAILAAARRREPASLEIDGIDPLEHTGWSVIVVGTLLELPDDEARRHLPLRPWASGLKDRFVALSLDEISGIAIPAGRGNR